MRNELQKWIEVTLAVFVQERKKEMVPLQEYVHIDKMIAFIFLSIPNDVCIYEYKAGRNILQEIRDCLKVIHVKAKENDEQYVKLIGYLPVSPLDMDQIPSVFMRLFCKTMAGYLREEQQKTFDELIIGYAFWGKVRMLQNEVSEYSAGEAQVLSCASLFDDPESCDRERMNEMLEMCGMRAVPDKRELEKYFEMGRAYLEEKEWKENVMNPKKEESFPKSV